MTKRQATKQDENGNGQCPYRWFYRGASIRGSRLSDGPKLCRPAITAYSMPVTPQMDRVALLDCIAVYMVLRVV